MLSITSVYNTELLVSNLCYITKLFISGWQKLLRYNYLN